LVLDNKAPEAILQPEHEISIGDLDKKDNQGKH